MAAEEIGEARSFVRDLIREQLPDGVRLVALCRTHRQEYFDLRLVSCGLSLNLLVELKLRHTCGRFSLTPRNKMSNEFHR